MQTILAICYAVLQRLLNLRVNQNESSFSGVFPAMILSGHEIRERMGSDINITPFQEDCLNPNSYNLTLHNELLVYEEVVLDAKQPNRFRRIVIPEEGIILSPCQIYLGRTMEYTETRNLVPMIEGRSSVARLGLFVPLRLWIW